MGIYDVINDATLNARKSAIKETDPGVKAECKMIAALMVGIQGDVKALQKSATKEGKMPDIDDEMCMRALRGALKGQEETLRLIEEAGQTDRVQEVKTKIGLIKNLMPEMVGEFEVRAAVQDMIDNRDPNEISKGFMGVIMKALNNKFGTSLDRSMASRIAKEMTSV